METSAPKPYLEDVMAGEEIDRTIVHQIADLARFYHYAQEKEERPEARKLSWNKAIAKAIAEDPRIPEELVPRFFGEAHAILWSQARRRADELPSPRKTYRSRHARPGVPNNADILAWWTEFSRDRALREREACNMKGQRGGDPDG